MTHRLLLTPARPGGPSPSPLPSATAGPEYSTPIGVRSSASSASVPGGPSYKSPMTTAVGDHDYTPGELRAAKICAIGLWCFAGLMLEVLLALVFLD
jgi:hypothetical protein